MNYQELQNIGFQKTDAPEINEYTNGIVKVCFNERMDEIIGIFVTDILVQGVTNIAELQYLCGKAGRSLPSTIKSKA